MAACLALVAMGAVTAWALIAPKPSATVEGAGTVTHDSAMGVGGTVPAGTTSVAWTVTHEGDDEPYASGTSEVADGHWQADWCLLRPGENTVVVTPEGGAPTTATITYENCTFQDPEPEHVLVDTESGIPYVDNRLLVAFEEGVSDEEAQGILSDIGALELGRLWGAQIYQVEVPSLSGSSLGDVAAYASGLEEDERILFAAPDADRADGEESDSQAPGSDDAGLTFAPPDDPWVDDDGNGPNGWSEVTPDGTNWGLEAIRDESAREYLRDHSLAQVTVGVADGYYDRGHVDIEYSFTCAERAQAHDDALAQARRDAGDDSDKLRKVERELIHGMHVAGIIGARRNNGGVGVSGTCDCRLLVDCNRSVGHWATATENLIESGAKVVNLSWGMVYSGAQWQERPDQAIEESLRSADVASCIMRRELKKRYDESTGRYRDDFVIVQAAGNGTSDGGIPVDAQHNGMFASITPTLRGDSEGIPAQDVYDRIIVVGNAMRVASGDGTQTPASVSYQQAASSNGGDRVDLCAPGTNILSTFPSNGYGYRSGTSMAAPYVSGVAAMMWSANPSLSGAEIKRLLCESASIPVAVSPEYGRDRVQKPSRLLDAYAAVQAAASGVAVTPEPIGREPEGAPVQPVVHAPTFDDIVAEYREVVNSGWDSGVIAAQPDIAQQASAVAQSASRGELVYRILDMNGDGVEELIIAHTGSTGNLPYLFDIWVMVDGAAHAPMLTATPPPGRNPGIYAGQYGFFPSGDDTICVQWGLQNTEFYYYRFVDGGVSAAYVDGWFKERDANDWATFHYYRIAADGTITEMGHDDWTQVVMSHGETIGPIPDVSYRPLAEYPG